MPLMASKFHYLAFLILHITFSIVCLLVVLIFLMQATFLSLECPYAISNITFFPRLFFVKVHCCRSAHERKIDEIVMTNTENIIIYIRKQSHINRQIQGKEKLNNYKLENMSPSKLKTPENQ